MRIDGENARGTKGVGGAIYVESIDAGIGAGVSKMFK